MIRNVIFDWSGTLVDDLPAVLAATNEVFVQFGAAPLTLDQFRAEFKLPFAGFYERYFPDIHIDKLEKHFHGSFAVLQKNVVALPFAGEFLAFCRARKLRTFVLTTVAPQYYKLQAAATGFDRFIDRPYTGVWDKRKVIIQLLTENKLKRDETVFIGDMQHDVDTARHGGIASCAVLTGYNRLHQLRASQPDLIVEHLGELRAIMERNNGDFRAAPAPPEPVCTVGALIWNRKREVLMIRTQKWSGLWGIPGGKVKRGETCLAALKREIKEETRLSIDQIELAMVQDCIDSKEFYRDAHFVLLNYTCRARSQVVKLNHEAQEFRWMTPVEALKIKLNQPTRKLIKHVLANK